MIPVYRVSIDPKYQEDKELGIFEIANTINPAIKIKGVAFHSQEKKVCFTDNLKYRIAAPVLTPGDVYRREEDGEEWYAEITVDEIETMFVDFMAKRMGKQVFNDEHDESKKVPAYPLETWLVEDPETDKSKTVYGIEVPKGTWFMVQQFTDKDVYKEFVEAGKTGFSIHGRTANIEMSQINKANMSNEANTEMNADGKPSAYLELPVGVHTIGDSVYTVEEVVENEGTENEYRCNKIVSIVPTGEASTEMEDKDETEMMEDKKEEKTEMSEEVTTELESEESETKMEEDKKEEEEETEMAEDETTGDPEVYTREEIDAKFKELYDMIAELKSDTAEEDEEVAESNTQMSEDKKDVPRWQGMGKKLEAFAKFSANKN